MKPGHQRKIVGSVVLAAIAALGVLFYISRPGTDPAPPLNAYSLVEDKFVSLPEVTRRPAILIFWATWCGPCRIEMRRLQQAVVSGWIPPGQVYAISVGEPLEVVKSYAENSDYAFQFFAVPDKTKLENYQIEGTPSTYHLNAKNEVVWSRVGLAKNSMELAKRLFSVE